MNHFHNSTKENERDSNVYEHKAKTQDERIEKFFSGTCAPMSPSMVWEFTGMKMENVPLTSVRRAMSNLSKGEKPVLRKLANKVTSPFGRPEHLYILKGRVWIGDIPNQDDMKRLSDSIAGTVKMGDGLYPVMKAIEEEAVKQHATLKLF